jgi:hypothetical protein
MSELTDFATKLDDFDRDDVVHQLLSRYEHSHRIAMEVTGGWPLCKDLGVIHALLSQAAATAALAVQHRRMTDSYNGWKDLGR